jgi:alanyl aminopeptidase
VRHHLAIALSLGLAACPGKPQTTSTTPGPKASPSPAADAPPAARPAPTPPAFRLGADIVPTRYALELTIDPAKDDFSGVIDVDLQLARDADAIWLNARDLTITDATVSAGGTMQSATTITAPNEIVGFAVPQTIPAGAAKLHVAYTGRIENVGTDAIFRQKDGDDWYVYTQFEPLDARQALPCFDEPGYKVPWQLTLVVPAGQTAVSNTPIAGETDRAGKRAITFGQTPPLPSYLIAFGVGPFDVYEAGTAGRKKTPIRFYTMKGRGSEARWAAQATRELLVVLEDLFDIPYPYEKLDNLVIPVTVNFGAMENVGLITYRQNIVLAKPEEETEAFKRRYSGTIAHELAHQWFGDLVTLAWWDDIWLNEAFATWASSRATQLWKPEWDEATADTAWRHEPMRADSMVSARRIRQPIESHHDIASAFDRITYGKGAMVIAMFEEWTSRDVFRKGVKSYLEAHAHRTATSSDFVAAIARAAGKDELVAAFASFTDQAGLPLIEVGLVCAEGREPRLSLTQKRYLPAGSPGSSEGAWRVPVCARWEAGGAAGRACTLLTEPAGELPLSGAAGCPTWVTANAGAAGYYRVHYEDDLLRTLVDKGLARMTNQERFVVLDDADAMVASGRLASADLLALLPRFLEAKNRHLTERVAEIVEGLDANLVPDALRPRYAKLVRDLFGAQARKLGLTHKKGDDDEAILLRPAVTRIVAIQGEDKTLAAEARRLALRWLDDRKAVPDEMIETVLQIAAHRGDAALHDRLVAELKKSKIRRERYLIIDGLVAFTDPALARRTQELALTDEVEPKEALDLVKGPIAHRRTRDPAWTFFREAYDRLAARVPPDWGRQLLLAAEPLCSEAHQSEVASLFTPKVDAIPGGPRILAQRIEAIALCTAERNLREPSVKSFLEKRR